MSTVDDLFTPTRQQREPNRPALLLAGICLALAGLAVWVFVLYLDASADSETAERPINISVQLPPSPAAPSPAKPNVKPVVTIYDLPAGYPDVSSFCDGNGFRVYITAAGEARAIATRDPKCPGGAP